jgi:hypothetical protein
MNGVADRSQDFFEGSESVRKPSFKPVRIQSYRRTSTLDNLYPTGNGMAQRDTQRVMLGIPRSSIGQSDETFDKSLWLPRDHPESFSASLYNKTYQ